MMQALTHQGIASLERMRQGSKSKPFIHVRKVCGRKQPDGTSCTSQVTEKQRRMYIYCAGCVKKMKVVA